MMRATIYLFLLFTFLCSEGVFAAGVNIIHPQVEYTKTPLGIEVEHPRFSWQMLANGNQRGTRQTAYQLIVTNDVGEVVWNSGKIKSGVSLNIEYTGKTLMATTRYSWKICVWDQLQQQHSVTSWFETGLMNNTARGSTWSGAKWIGGGDEDLPLYAQYLPVFSINYEMHLNAQTSATRAGFVYGANDIRLLDKSKNQYQLQNARDSAAIIIELDIAPLLKGDSARLNVYRTGYHPADKREVPFRVYKISRAIINNDNKYNKHQFSITSNLGVTRIFIDGNTNKNLVADVNLNPLGRGGDFIAFPVLGDVGYHIPQGQSASFSKVQIQNFRQPSNVLYEAAPVTINGGADGVFTLFDPGHNSMPMLRTAFDASNGKVASARLYVTSRGIYEVYLNGSRIGNDYFNPGATQYNKTQLYQTYDVTQFIQAGKNVMGAMLAEGWWSGGSTYAGENWNYFGDRQSLLAKLVVTYADGKQDIVVSDPYTWQYFNDGPVTYGSFFQGEVYDATRELAVKDWCTSSYNASKWKGAREVALKSTINGSDSNYNHVLITAQLGDPVRQVKELTAKSVEEVRPGVFVYDMGQNMVGVPTINLSGAKPGARVIIRYAEVKYPDMPEYKQHTGMVMLENIRAAMAQDIYIAKGGEETMAPRFTFHGYRFLEITGLDHAIPVTAVKGRVLSSIAHLTSDYETSNPKVNQLWQNITWSTMGNFLSIPTDCPQRNERLGWSGDISVFSRTATYVADVAQFFRRHMLAMRDVQRADGRFADVAPLGVGFGGLLWGSAGITVAWESYQQYADKRLLTEHYDAMKAYIRYIVDKNIDSKTGILTQENPTDWGNLGDWLGPEQEKNDNSLLWEVYFIFDLDIMGNIAGVLGKTDDAKWFNELHTERKKFFNTTYFNTATGKTVHSGFRQNKLTLWQPGDLLDTQTSYTLPLAFDALDEANQKLAIDQLVTTITRQNQADDRKTYPSYSLMTGFIGTAWISKALSVNGRPDVAYKLLQQTSFPSWLYPVDQGATTIWERLNSYTQTNGFGGNNNMNSFNHYSFGAVGAWMYNYSLGIERDENSPGFKHFILQPEPDATGQMSFAKGYYESMYGTIESSWRKSAHGYRYRFIVPANTTATLYIRADAAGSILEKGQLLNNSPTVRYTGRRGAKYVFELQSGEYNITSK